MKERINSYREGEMSALVQSGKYTLFFQPWLEDSEWVFIRIVNHKEIFEPINKEEYSLLDYDMYMTPGMNDGAKVVLVGKVVDINKVKVSFNFNIYMKVADADGNEYLTFHSLGISPVMFDIGSEYTFYVCIRAYDGITLSRLILDGYEQK